MRFTIRDLLWLTAVVAISCCWFKCACELKFSSERARLFEVLKKISDDHSRRIEDGWRSDLEGEWVRANELSKTVHVLASEVVELRKQRENTP